MTRTEHLLAILAEECDEVSQRAIKALRFTLNEVQPGQEYHNAIRIVHEYADLVGAFELLRAEPSFYPLFDEQSSWFRGMVEDKKEKVEKFLLLSKSLGALTQ